MHTKVQRQCFACTTDVDRANWRVESYYRIYEQIVEAVEGLPDGVTFTITELWRIAGAGPDRWHKTVQVVKDMEMHGLVHCVRKDAPGRRCMAYRRI